MCSLGGSAVVVGWWWGGGVDLDGTLGTVFWLLVESFHMSS